MRGTETHQFLAAYVLPVRLPSDPIEYFDTPGPYVERAAGGSWYYCSDPPGYFPHVSLCRRPWIAVAPFAVQGGAAKPQALR